MKSWYQSLSLHSKQILIIILINAVSLLVASTLYFYNNVSSYQERQIEELEGKSKVIAGTITSALLFQDNHSAHEQLSTLVQDSGILYAGIFDDNKQFFANYVGSLHFRRPSLAEYDTGLHYLPNSIATVDEIYYDNELIGYLYLAQDTSDLTEQMIRHALITLVVFVMSLLFAYTLSMLMQRWLTKPIKDLVEVIQHITSSKDFNQRLLPSHNDEIGQLINSFNTMIEAIKQRDEKLRAHGEELEDLVNLRTRQLHQRSNYDGLTKLPNRHFLIEQLEHEIEIAGRENSQIAVMFLDLDRFKVINDNLGHAVGDEVLKITAERLSKAVRSNDNVARWGGDEFVIFLSNVDTLKDIENIASKVLASIEEVMLLADRQFHISTSIGISLYPHNGKDAFTLLKHADVSMYRAKERGVGNFCFYNTDMDEGAFDRLSMETKLRRAVENKQLKLVYQPKINIHQNALSGVEALIRWEDEELGFVPPSQFIPLAEEIGIINKIGEFVLESACRQHAEWRVMGIEPMRIAINLSPTHLIEPTLVDYVKRELEFYKISAEYLELEITEETFLDADDQCQKNLTRLHDYGIRISIDDFGTGYSCLSYLLDLPVTTLKIDGSFVRKLGTQSENDGIVNAIMTLGHGLGLEVVAECVETKAQLDFLDRNGCDVIQGYYFSKPLSPDELIRYIDANFPR
ncbi:putative signaling protein [BD1-7 clade bacterium]|uniref:cyclic-guanylate-specific phosphodiesterase n=1 Tax=BD1-7 clade bacterium TaxID=2029982 RepID=A0A5S9PAC3_9GAMM|nr:putative signaling protein [BD1-7 clade bacterium]CAA0108156.1 putative signaling protein [BD1-7 clade bacterium]CAA0108172.1 putative signaling protein [BD1-7 clade bacterium]